MDVPRQVLGVRDVRNHTSEVFAAAKAGEVIFAGSQRKAEVAIMSIDQYEKLTLTAEQERGLHNAIASAEMEGQEFTDDEKEMLRELAAGKITGAELLARALPEYPTLS